MSCSCLLYTSRVFRNFDGDITSRIHPVSYALKGEEGEGTRYEYNADGNCIRILYPDGGVERRFYDADGNMICLLYTSMDR